MQSHSTPPCAASQDAFKLGTRAEFAVVWSLCVMAALRVFLFSAAFPFFNNVDEQYHFDLVLRHARGNASPPLAPVSAEAAEYIALYESPEYYMAPKDYPDGKASPPVWILPRAAALARFKGFQSLWQSRPNYEGISPPLYYYAAGLWWRIGEMFGMEGGYLLYWVRFLNVFIGAALVWLGYWAARLVFPGPWFTRLAVAVLLAFYPQDIFYSIQSDVFSPLLFGLAFIGLLKLWRTETPGVRLAIFTGIAIAGTALVKATNLPLLAVSLLVIACKIWRLSKAGKFRAALPAFVLLGLCVLLPVGAWLLWNHRHFGDLTGITQKMRLMGWTRKPLNQWWPHPLFTWRGQKEFLGGLLASFWRGEFRWNRHLLASPLADTFYCLSSWALIAANFPALVRKNSNDPPLLRPALWMALGCFAAAIIFQALSSMAFDFGACENPSRAHPFFTSGRLISGTLIPFLLLYARGLDKLLAWRGYPWVPLAALVTIVLLITVSEIQLNSPAFSSPYNFFHLGPLKTAIVNVPTLYLAP